MDAKILGLILCLSLVLMPFFSASADQKVIIRTDDETATTKTDVVKEKKENPVIDIPVGAAQVMYGGFEGFGVLFDGIVTGDKPPKKSLKTSDPLPLTNFEDRYDQLMQFDYGVGNLDDFATTNQKENMSTSVKR